MADSEVDKAIKYHTPDESGMYRCCLSGGALAAEVIALRKRVEELAVAGWAVLDAFPERGSFPNAQLEAMCALEGVLPSKPTCDRCGGAGELPISIPPKQPEREGKP